MGNRHWLLEKIIGGTLLGVVVVYIIPFWKPTLFGGIVLGIALLIISASVATYFQDGSTSDLLPAILMVAALLFLFILYPI